MAENKDNDREDNYYVKKNGIIDNNFIYMLLSTRAKFLNAQPKYKHTLNVVTYDPRKYYLGVRVGKLS